MQLVDTQIYPGNDPQGLVQTLPDLPVIPDNFSLLNFGMQTLPRLPKNISAIRPGIDSVLPPLPQEFQAPESPRTVDKVKRGSLVKSWRQPIEFHKPVYRQVASTQPLATESRVIADSETESRRQRSELVNEYERICQDLRDLLQTLPQSAIQSLIRQCDDRQVLDIVVNAYSKTN